MAAFREDFEILKTYYKKELFFWFLGIFLFIASVFFLIYESINLFKVTALRERVLEYRVKTMRTLSSSKELFKIVGKNREISQIKEVRISGEVGLENLERAIKFFEKLNEPEKGKFFILEEATKDKNLLKFRGKKFYLK